MLHPIDYSRHRCRADTGSLGYLAERGMLALLSHWSSLLFSFRHFPTRLYFTNAFASAILAPYNNNSRGAVGVSYAIQSLLLKTRHSTRITASHCALATWQPTPRR